MTGPYDDIIHLSHHVSPTRHPMPLADRAAQFSPFAALTGHGAAINETARLTDKRIEIGEDCKSVLSMKLNQLEDIASDHPNVAITYFQPDEQKDGGAYVTITGGLKKIDNFEEAIIMMDGTKISIGEILEVESKCLETFSDIPRKE